MGPADNEKGSPYQVSWGVRPQVVTVNIATVEPCRNGDDFNEAHAHGARYLIKNTKLLSNRLSLFFYCGGILWWQAL